MKIYTISPDEVTLPGGRVQKFKKILKLEDYREDLEKLNKASRGEGELQDEEVMGLGRRLFDQVFPADHTFPDTIYLEMKEDFLHLLPWEHLHDGEKFLALDHGLCRLAEGPQCSLHPISERPLKVNVALSSPLLRYDIDHGPVQDEKGVLRQPEEVDPPIILDIRSEIRNFNRLEKTHFAVDFHIHRRICREDFINLLEDGADVLHFSGHGNKGVLCLENPYAIEEGIRAEKIGHIRLSSTYQMIVLNSCKTAAFLNNFKDSLAGSFLSQGVPAIIAMSRTITQDAAFALTKNLYREISRCKTLPQALRKARQAIKDQGGLRWWEFATPVLFLNKCLIGNGSLILHKPQEEAQRQVRVITQGGVIREDREEKFAGRRRQLVEVAKFLNKVEGYEKKVAFIHGPGGIGKTALALEAGHRFSEDYDYAVFVSARRELPHDEFRKLLKATRKEHIAKSSLQVLNNIIQEICLAQASSLKDQMPHIPSFPNSLQASEAIYCKIKEGKRWLIIMDNLEDLSDAIEDKERIHEDIVSFIDRLPTEKCRLILTSRWVFTNLPFSCYHISLPTLNPRDVGEMIARHRKEWRKIPTSSEISLIHEKTGGHPFALLLALSRLIEDEVSLGTILSEIGDEKEKAWEYLFSSSLRRVSEEGKIILGALSLSSPDVDIEALQSIVKKWVKRGADVIHRLFRLSLIQRREVPFLFSRYSLLPLTSPFVQKILDKSNLSVNLKKNFGLYFLSKTQDMLDGMKKDDPLIEYIFHQEVYNLNHAGQYLYDQGLWNETLSLFECGLKFSAKLKDDLDIAMFTGNIGSVYKAKGEWGKALEF